MINDKTTELRLFNHLKFDRKPFLSAMLTVSIALCLVGAAQTSADQTVYNWPNRRGPTFNGISSESGWRTDWNKNPPKHLWKVSVGTGFSSIIVVDGRIYTMGNRKDNDIVHCLDVKTGKQIWQHSYPCELDPNMYEGGPGSTPSVDGDRLYTFSKTGIVYCLNAEVGNVIWSRDLATKLGLKAPSWGFSGSPLIAGKLLVLNAGTAGIALDKENGDVIWQSAKNGAGYATPVLYQIGNQKGVAIFAAKAIKGINIINGAELWNYPWRTSWGVNAADPIISGDKVFLSSSYNKGCALIKVVDNAPELVWRNKSMRNHINNSVLLNGYIYGFDGHAGEDGALKCIDFRTGRTLWAEQQLIFGSLMLADKKLIVLTDSGDLIVADASPQRYSELGRTKALDGKCWTVPVLCGGKVFARNAGGDLVCIDVAK